MREFDRANLKHPTFKEEHGGVTAIIPREIFMSIRAGKGVTDSNGAIDDAKNGANFSERQKEIISLIKTTPSISLDEIAKKLKLGSRTVDREMKKLSDIIKRVGPRNGGYWEVIE